ncbi:MAG: DUF2807 domain-containing protein [Bacteroidales bacterium]
MRTCLTISLLILVLLPGLAQETSSTIESPFRTLKVSGNIHLFLHPSDHQALEISSGADPEATIKRELDLDKGALLLRTETEITQSEAVRADLYYVSLEALELQKGARVQSPDTLRAKTLVLDVLNGAKTELFIHADSLSARVNQGADIILYGVVRAQSINAYTWGNFLGYDLQATDTYVKAATGAQVKVWTTKRLEANATGKAFVGYKGNPKRKETKATVGGEISPYED